MKGGKHMRNFIEKAQGMVEYAFILVLVAIVIIVAVATMGPGVGNMYMSVVNSL
jgi:pilus assembly protein Flp/PilA